jgi:hypothetical protein
VAELVLSVADVSTNLVMLTGSQGVGRSLLAASLAQELVNTQHWTDAYWIDLQGVTNVVLAGVCGAAAAVGWQLRWRLRNVGCCCAAHGVLTCVRPGASTFTGQQLMAGLGLVTDVSDTQQLLAWLEGRPRERFGIVLTHVQVSGRAAVSLRARGCGLCWWCEASKAQVSRWQSVSRVWSAGGLHARRPPCAFLLAAGAGDGAG